MGTRTASGLSQPAAPRTRRHGLPPTHNANCPLGSRPVAILNWPLLLAGPGWRLRPKQALSPELRRNASQISMRDQFRHDADGDFGDRMGADVETQGVRDAR